MDLRKLKTLIELVETSGIAELEIQEGEERVRITRSVATNAAHAIPPPQLVTVAGSVAGVTAAGGAPAGLAVPSIDEGHVVKSPMVGTFYRAATPGSKAFVEI